MLQVTSSANETVPQVDHTWLTVREVADVTRFSPTTVLRAIRHGQLTATRMGERQYRITQRSFNDWVRRGMPTSEGEGTDNAALSV